MTEDPCYRRGAVLWRQTYDRVLILLPSSGQFITLEATGRDLWAALEEPGTVHDLACRLAADFGAPVAQIASDITPVIEELDRRGAVVATGRRP